MIRSKSATLPSRPLVESAALFQIPAGLSALVAAGHICAALQNDLPLLLTRWVGWKFMMAPWRDVSTIAHLCLAFQNLCQAIILYRIASLILECLQEKIFTVSNVRSLRVIGFAGLASLCIPFFTGFIEGITDLPTAPPSHQAIFYDVTSASDLGLVALPFVMAWIFQKGLELRKELDEVV
ncbi:DUF2975 domain-containing protein [Gluconobacter sp. OJB]|uniref:DUF2975 domain-containing protein n=1 Tax=Gluconobacter sp. OJB TaxID=3145196 RepID=UPI0031F8D193